VRNNQLTAVDVVGLTNLNYLNCSNNNLSEAVVDQILADMVANNYTGPEEKYINLDGTNSAPSSGGMNNRAILISRGFTVIVNLPLDAFWSGISEVPLYTTEGTVEFQLLPNNLNIYPRSGLISFTSTDSNVGGSINASNCVNLTHLTCHSNQLTDVDVSGCTNITSINVRNNQLATIDVANLTKINYLNCSDNNFSEAVVDQILADMVANNYTGPEEKYINLDGTNSVPSVAGFANKTILEQRGFVVIVNLPTNYNLWQFTSSPGDTLNDVSVSFNNVTNVVFVDWGDESIQQINPDTDYNHTFN
jgi:Leucine-rich repeat (LRR) protein